MQWRGPETTGAAPVCFIDHENLFNVACGTSGRHVVLIDASGRIVSFRPATSEDSSDQAIQVIRTQVPGAEGMPLELRVLGSSMQQGMAFTVAELRPMDSGDLTALAPTPLPENLIRSNRRRRRGAGSSARNSAGKVDELADPGGRSLEPTVTPATQAYRAVRSPPLIPPSAHATHAH